MKAEITIDEVAGRTLERVVFSQMSRQALLVFADGTFATLGIERGYEQGDEEICADRLDLFNFGDSTLIACGVLTREEFESMRDARDAAHRMANQERERQQFERLKKLYGE